MTERKKERQTDSRNNRVKEKKEKIKEGKDEEEEGGVDTRKKTVERANREKR